MTYPRKGRICLGTRSMGKLYRLTIQIKAVFKDFSYTLRVPSTDYFKSIASHTKIHNSAYVYENFLEEFAFLYRKIFEKLLQPVMFLKMLVFTGIFLSFFDPFQNFSSLFHQVTLVPINFMHAFKHQMKNAGFRPKSSW